MRWTLTEGVLPEESSLCSTGLCAFLTEDGRVLVPAGAGPACIFDSADVYKAASWKLLQSFAPVHPIRLVSFLHHRFPEIPDSELCAVMNIKADYRGLADVQHARLLDEVSVKLAEKHDLPLHVVRLFSRIAEREELFALFEKRSVRKNLIREMIQDLYDLSADKRTVAAAQLREYSDQWQSAAVFPAEELRDLVRRARYPRSEELRTTIRRALARMNLPAGVQIEIPPDLENGKPRMTLDFSSLEDLTRLSQALTDEALRSQAAVILSALQAK